MRIALIVLLVAIIALSGCAQKLQVCPDKWYDNQFPSPVSERFKETQYFVIDGERVEPSKVDVEWVKNNCNITLTIVS